MKASWRYWIKSQISLVESTQLNSPLSCCQDWRGTWSTSPCTPRHHHHCHQLESCQEHSPLQCRSRAPWISVSPWTWSRVREMRDETLHHWISDNPGCWSLSLKSWFKPHVETQDDHLVMFWWETELFFCSCLLSSPRWQDDRDTCECWGWCGYPPGWTSRMTCSPPLWCSGVDSTSPAPATLHPGTWHSEWSLDSCWHPGSQCSA